MSERLTAGRMINQLKVGEIAIGERKSGVTFKVKLFSNGLFDLSADGHKTLGATVVNNGFLKAEWRILPKYVKFEEAMYFHKETKKPVTFHDGDGNFYEFKEREYDMFGFMHDNKFTLMHLIDGKWTIEEEK